MSTIKMALFKAQRLWPTRRRQGDHDRLKPLATAVADHQELCGMRCVGKAPGLGPGASDLCPERRKDAVSGARNGPEQES